MKIGIIGLGKVGTALYKGFKKHGHTLVSYDIKDNSTTISNLLSTEIIYIAVPTPKDKENNCDVSIVDNSIKNLSDHNYNGIICIKSTVPPGTTESFIRKFNNKKICFCPEFLRERCADEDFQKHNPICVIGTIDDTSFNIVKMSHLGISSVFKLVRPIEAELTKYFQNVYNTQRILFANAFYEICQLQNVNYNSIIDSLVLRKEMDDRYLRCDETLRGPSGPCLVKDTLAFHHYVEKLGMPFNIFRTMVHDMELYPKTVIKGTRDFC